MLQRGFCFVVVLVLFFCGEIFSQSNPAFLRLPVDYRQLKKSQSENSFSPGISSVIIVKKFKKIIAVPLKTASNFLYSPAPYSVLPASYYCNGLGFFCKKEIQFEKATSIPFRFRIGSIDYVDYLEQKPNAVNPFR